MSVVQPLLDLQEIDGRIRDLQQEIRDIPQRKDQELERLNGAREALARAQAEYKNAQLRVNEADLEVKARRDKILALKQNQVSLKTNKEFQIFNLEIAKIEGGKTERGAGRCRRVYRRAGCPPVCCAERSRSSRDNPRRSRQEGGA